MKLFEIDENYQVQPNKVWIGLIPELAELLRRDKGSKGDNEGRKKLRARKEFAYIYFSTDFSSPLRDWEPKEKEEEALAYAELTREDIDDKVVAAREKYKSLQLKASRSLRTYESMMRGLDAVDKQFEEIDFTLTDKTGALVNSADKYISSISKMSGAYDALDKFRKRVEEDLTNNESGIRGQATLGDNEGKRTNANTTWSESEIREKSAEKAGQTEEKNETKTDVPSFASIGAMLKEASLKPHLTDEQIANGRVLGEEDTSGKKKFIEL